MPARRSNWPLPPCERGLSEQGVVRVQIAPGPCWTHLASGWRLIPMKATLTDAYRSVSANQWRVLRMLLSLISSDNERAPSLRISCDLYCLVVGKEICNSLMISWLL